MVHVSLDHAQVLLGMTFTGTIAHNVSPENQCTIKPLRTWVKYCYCEKMLNGYWVVGSLQTLSWAV